MMFEIGDKVALDTQKYCNNLYGLIDLTKYEPEHYFVRNINGRLIQVSKTPDGEIMSTMFSADRFTLVERKTKFADIQVGWRAKLKSDKVGRVSVVAPSHFIVTYGNKSRTYGRRYGSMLFPFDTNEVFPMTIEEIVPPTGVDVRITLDHIQIEEFDSQGVYAKDRKRVLTYYLYSSMDKDCAEQIKTLVEDIKEHRERK